MSQLRVSRQACDLCYNKRIKCDAQKPRCSHCVVYNSDCTYKAASRKAPARKQRPSKGDEPLQSRVERLENRLNEALEKIENLESLVPQTSIASGSPSLVGACQRDMDLPPLIEVLPAVELYLATFNSVLPLFHPGTLMQFIHDWYRYPDQRDCITWAAINVVLALAHRHSDPGDIIPARNTAHYLNKAQSVLTEVTMRSTHLLNVQVLVGLVILYQGAPDTGPPTMLIATALRLAHRLQLHNRRSSGQLDDSLVLQRNRVFWIIYILDRDTSMRIRQAPLQLDDDIDLDLPPDDLEEDDAGFVLTADGRTMFNFFRARVQLARIQGRLYSCLHSVRAQNASPDQRAHDMNQIRHMLNDWTSHVPQNLFPGALSQAAPSTFSRNFGILWATRLSCLSLVSQSHSWDTRWMETLQDLGTSVAKGKSAVPVPLPSPLPEGWQMLVHESREFMRFFISIEKKDAAFLWMTACAYISGMICLTANNLCNPNHGAVGNDRQMVQTALLFLEDTVRHTSQERLGRIRDACKELVRHDHLVARQILRDELLVDGQFVNEEPPPSSFIGLEAGHMFENDAPVTTLGPLYFMQ